MKEVTYEDWQKNPTPRMMWVWDGNENNKKQRKVIYFLKPELAFPIVVLTEDEIGMEQFKHCAEIGEQRRMTYKELSRWLREKPTRECKYRTSEYVCSAFEYKECKQDKEVLDDILIRENSGEWREPLVEVEE